ncbi:glycoside hydrolase family 3 domain protein [Catenulispora acidiphila DSM 44928]|uniref:Exo-alpha-(1->6)-L-arabinopyranosidase n=1 Tax=Catenulispora acidiphila (strain DSM 44928 / JCM 14897 / NBRC 102108 / NRRL B-24433 / ID139908) TaxID=479433 RepID=C7Q3F1_CATAD|nr:glycoside hydrolase family 3 C-terminal domain-containing protein [Catenulispora acidiphila]ACU75716.1 glycoside hydrolase family 3 domain protein [Catenulispora acidiphila DSM 44928]
MRVRPLPLTKSRAFVALTALSLGAAGLLSAELPASAAPAASATCPWVGSNAPVASRVSQLMAKMSLSQEISMMTGTKGSSFVGETPAIGSLCIPAMNLEDGPAGVADGMTGVTQLPAPVSAAATWDTGAESAYGKVIGSEEAAKGSTVDLGPTINIVRDPRWGRAFESIGEDPYLNGVLGAAEIRGVQSTGEMAQVKHLAAYNQETHRNTSSDNVIVDQRTLEEIYLPAFDTSVGSGAASSVMCSYSTINGTYACQNPNIMNDVIHKQFGSNAFITSDWGALHTTAGGANAGLDQDMPGDDGYYGGALQTAVNNGQVSKATIDAAVRRVLTQMFGFGMFDNVSSGSPRATVTSSAHTATARQIADQGTVLLKNANNQLPLTSSTKSIAVIGADASTSVRSAGGGSASVKAGSVVSPLAGITSRAGSGVTVTYNDGSSSSSAATAAGKANVAVVFVSKSESEGGDLSNIDLASSDNALISAVAKANPHTVVVLNTGSAVTMPWLSSVSGVFEAWYSGQEDGNAIADLLFGDVDPSGHLPVTFPTSLSQVPANTAAQWPGANNKVEYSEGLQVGYRHYDATNQTPLFPFGFGLSYTSFSFSNLTVGSLTKGGSATVTAKVTNTGSRAGSEVAQLYVVDPSSSGEPSKQLQGFGKVTLAAGASTTVSFPVTEENLRHWNTGSNAWTTDTGAYGIRVGDSAANIPLSGTLNVTSAQLGQPVTVTNPGPQATIAGATVSVPVTAKDSTGGQTPAFSATGLPAGLSISASGTITGTPTSAGTTTVDVTAKDGNGATATTSFVWTVSPSTAGVPTVPYVGQGGKCLDLAADDNTNGAKVEIYTCNNTSGQSWSHLADGTLRSAGKCMDVKGAGTANGTLVQIYDCNGTGAQVWKSGSNGSLINPASGKCLDDPKSSTTDGTQLQIWDCNGNSNQSWVPRA